MKTRIKLLLCLSPIFVLTVGCNKKGKPTVNTIESKEYDVLKLDADTETFKPVTEGVTKITLNNINNSPVKYFDLEYYNNTFLKEEDANLYTFKVENNIGTLQNKFNEGKAVIDYNNQKITYTKPSAFFSYSSKPLIDNYSDGAKDLFVGGEKWSDTFTYTPNKTEYVLDLSKYSINLYCKDNKMYLPYNLCGVLFFEYSDKVPFFNGNNFYRMDYKNKDNEEESIDTNDEKNIKYMNQIRENATVYTKDYMEYSYNAFALTLDFRFGLKTRLLRETGKEYTYLKDGAYSYLSSFKDRMISLEKNVSNNAYIEFFNLYLNDGGHSGYDGLNTLVDKKHNYKIEGENEITYSSLWNLGIARYCSKRKCAPSNNNNGYVYFPSDKTAFVSFDKFNLSKNPSGEATEANYSEKTEKTIQWAHKKIEEKKGSVENLVIDISLNGGGAAGIAAYVASWALRKPIEVKLNYALDGAMLSGKIESNIKVNESVKNIYVMTSLRSFSSANYCATLFDDQGGDNVKFIGSNTGGGCCNSYGLNNTLGSTIRLSGNTTLQRSDATIEKTHNDEEGVTHKEFFKRINCYGGDISEYDSYYDYDALATLIENK